MARISTWAITAAAILKNSSEEAPFKMSRHPHIFKGRAASVANKLAH
jgi:hypothetical protein